jgi:Sulfotransferase family
MIRLRIFVSGYATVGIIFGSPPAGSLEERLFMLVSHTHKFIYMKTRKTGGTSVEIYFEPYCTDPARRGEIQQFREAEVSQWGIVGYRGPDPKDKPWYHHMPACEARERIGAKIWAEYFKFCVVRNPFDRVVSQFWSQMWRTKAELESAPFSQVKKKFGEWVSQRHLPLDRSVYTDGDDVVVDHFVHFERMHPDLEQVCQKLGVSWEPEKLGRYKSGFRTRNEHFIQYYSPDAFRLVSEAFAWEINYFGYADRCVEP